MHNLTSHFFYSPQHSATSSLGNILSPERTFKHNLKLCLLALLFAPLLAVSANTQAGAREQAKRIYERIAGAPPVALPSRAHSNLSLQGIAYLELLASILDPPAGTNPINDNNLTLCSDAGVTGGQCVALIAMQEPSFYSVTLKNWITPWTNEEQTVFGPLNDYTATAIGLIRDQIDFRELLYTKQIYIPNSGSYGAYERSNNTSYESLESAAGDLGDSDQLQSADQSVVTGLPGDAVAGVLSSRTAAKAFYVDGTNRAQLRFTLMNHLCTDLEQLSDISRSPDRIRQDVSRSPGGDSRVFLNSCIGCHAGMDPLAQAFAYYNYSYPSTDNDDPLYEQGQITYNAIGAIDEVTGTRVHTKYFNNNSTFRRGYITQNDHWVNYWREGINQSLGWSSSLPGQYDPNNSSDGSVAQLGRELSHSQAFASCTVRKAFTMVCLRNPTENDYSATITPILDRVSAAGGALHMQGLFAEIADGCKGE